jgi:hypothetical protein
LAGAGGGEAGGHEVREEGVRVGFAQESGEYELRYCERGGKRELGFLARG